MSNAPARNQVVERRGELMAELFLQELKPEFLARPTDDFAYDLLVGFRNSRGGVNTIGVQVKATERLLGDRYPISRRSYERWANSNIPVLLLVVDVKRNRLFYTWPSPEVARDSGESNAISIQLSEIEGGTKECLQQRLTQ